MNKNQPWLRVLLRTASYILVAALASGATLFFLSGSTGVKLGHLASVIHREFVEETDGTAMGDAAAHAMVASLGDRWSYYIPKEDYEAHLQNQENNWVGIGVTVVAREDGKGFDLTDILPESPAQKAGVQSGDLLTHVDETFVGAMAITDLTGMIKGEPNTQVLLTVERGGESIRIPVTRGVIHTPAAQGQLLEKGVGYVRIENFHSGAGEEILEQIRLLQEQGMTALVLDVRSNPGGFTTEMVKALDYLLPEGEIFRRVDNRGNSTVDYSDAACLELPMAVLINEKTYSAAEFFAAALREYDWAVTVGAQTSGKGRYQYTLRLVDGSAVNLSAGSYFTPKGVSLAEVGGLTPDIPVTLSQEAVDRGEDPQLQAAIDAVLQGN